MSEGLERKLYMTLNFDEHTPESLKTPEGILESIRESILLLAKSGQTASKIVLRLWVANAITDKFTRIPWYSGPPKTLIGFPVEIIPDDTGIADVVIS